MKKIYGHIIILAMTALIAAACSHDSDIVPENGGDVPVVPVAQETPIAFSAAQGEEQAVTRAHDTNGMTRAGTPLSESAKSFTVWGYKNGSYTQTGDVISYSDLQTVFPGYTVNWQSSSTSITNSNGWEYVNQQTGNAPEQTIKYWDWGAAAYRFFGVSGAIGTYEANVTSETYVITMNLDLSSRSAIEAIPYYSELWFSTGNKEVYPTREFSKPVQLVFTKPYSRVRFMYTYASPDDMVMIESQVFKPTADYTSESPTGIARKGSYIVTYPLTGTATKESYTIQRSPTGTLAAFKEDYDPNDPTKEYLDAVEGWYAVIPNTSQGSYTLTITIKGLEKSCTVPAEYMQWLPGYSYTYVFKINEKGGVEIDMVQSAVTPWTDIYSSENSVYNW